MANYTIFTRFLRLLHVPCTLSYSNMRFRAYPSRLALTAAADLLNEYGAKVGRIQPGDTVGTSSLPVPCMVQMSDGECFILTGFDNLSACIMDASGGVRSMSSVDFEKEWSGKALFVKEAGACSETGYAKHRFNDVSNIVEKWLMVGCGIFLTVYFVVLNGLFASWSAMVLLCLYGIGIYVCRLLILKQLNAESRAADRVCRVVQENGCSAVLHHDGSELFGLFPWSEIGITYFSVSFLTLLVCPQCVSWLAVASVCCLPYTIWSVCYQKFKIHAWCTLCLCVQTLFWIIFGVFAIGGHFKSILPLDFSVVVLLACYLGTLLLVHRMVPRLFHADLANAESSRKP